MPAVAGRRNRRRSARRMPAAGVGRGRDGCPVPAVWPADARIVREKSSRRPAPLGAGCHRPPHPPLRKSLSWTTSWPPRPLDRRRIKLHCFVNSKGLPVGFGVGRCGMTLARQPTRDKNAIAGRAACPVVGFLPPVGVPAVISTRWSSGGSRHGHGGNRVRPL